MQTPEMLMKNSGPAKHAGYRPDIDGLRSLAIIPVVLNHLGVRGFWGGFVGVDIFFVISGFLITGNIVSDVKRNRYSITDFYRRRIIRIFPALFLLIFVCSVLSCIVMLPSELVRFAKSLGAAAISGSNVLFYSESGYFEPAAKIKPLLHTWSLAIEEQFYIVWPLVLAPLTRHCPRAVPWVAGVIVGVSLAISAWMLYFDPSGAYYLLPSRAWELAIGALLATLPRFYTPNWLRQVLATCALAAILYAIRSFSEVTPFPGFAALIPCVGAAILISVGSSGSWVSAALSCRPMVFIGQISYSLYLWHWPIIVFASIGLFLPQTSFVKAVELLLGLAMAVLSTRYVERPFRQHSSKWSTKQVLFGGAMAMAFALAFSGALLITKGLPQRFTADEQAVASFEAMDGDALYRRGTCFAVGAKMAFDFVNCLKPASDRANLMLIGDSHAAHYWPGISQYRGKINIEQATHTGCKPVLYEPSSDPCQKFFRHILTHQIKKSPPDVLLFAARWRKEDVALLGKTLSNPAVRASHPLVLGPVVQYTSGLPRLLVYSRFWQKPTLIFQAVDPELAETDRAMAAMTARLGVPYISMLRRMCTGEQCMVWAAPHVPMQFDYGHFTKEGSERVTVLFMPDVMQRLGCTAPTARCQSAMRLHL